MDRFQKVSFYQEVGQFEFKMKFRDVKFQKKVQNKINREDKKRKKKVELQMCFQIFYDLSRRGQ